MLSCGCGESFSSDPPDGPSAAGWSTSFGDAGEQTITSVAVDRLGNVAVAGGFSGVADFGDGPVEAAGSADDVFVAKYDTDGELLWSRRFGDAGHQRADAIAIGPADQIVVAGHFGGSIDIGGEYLAADDSSDGFVFVLGPDGSEQWGMALAGMSSDRPQALSVDAAGNIVLAGVFEGDISLDGDLYTSAGEHDIFVVKLLADGDFVWVRHYGDIASDQVTDVAIDGDGDVVFTGYLRGGAVDFGGGSLDPVGTEPNDDAFIVALAPDGAHRWSKRLGDEQTQRGFGVAFDSADNVLAIGHFAGSVDFEGTTATSSGGFDAYVAKLEPDGTPIWSKRFGVTANQYGHRIGSGPEQDVLISGDFDGVVEFGGPELECTGERDIYLSRFDADGAHGASSSFGDDSEQNVTDLAVDGAGNAILVGQYAGTVDFGFGPHTAAGDAVHKPFIAKLAR